MISMIWLSTETTRLSIDLVDSSSFDVWGMNGLVDSTGKTNGNTPVVNHEDSLH